MHTRYISLHISIPKHTLGVGVPSISSENSRIAGLPDGKRILTMHLAVLTRYRGVSDRKMERQNWYNSNVAITL